MNKNDNCAGEQLGVIPTGEGFRAAMIMGTGHDDIDNFLRECLETMRAKGHDYRQGNDDDLLHNFRTVAESVGTDMEKVWFTYFYKHYSAVATFIKEGGQQESEPIEGRIKDLIVYLLLFHRMVQEKKASAWSRVREISEGADQLAVAKKGVYARIIDKNGSEKFPAESKLEPAVAPYGSEQGFAPLALEEVPEKPVIRIPSRPGEVEVDMDGATLRLDAQRQYELAGGAGVFVRPEVIEKSQDLLRRLGEFNRAPSPDDTSESSEVERQALSVLHKEDADDALNGPSESISEAELKEIYNQALSGSEGDGQP